MTGCRTPSAVIGRCPGSLPGSLHSFYSGEWPDMHRNKPSPRLLLFFSGRLDDTTDVNGTCPACDSSHFNLKHPDSCSVHNDALVL